jgi:hypothetical protein
MTIPTAFRDRLSSSLAYPIGAESLSEALAGVPQYGMLKVEFLRSPTMRSSDLQQILRSGAPLPVLTASFRKLGMFLSAGTAEIERGEYDEQWVIKVFPVPREQKATVRALLLRDGMPLVVDWLAQSRPATWLSGRKSLALQFTSASPALKVVRSG